MTRFLFALLFVLSIAAMSGCGKRESNQPQPGAAGHPEEMADSTRLDSARTSDSGGGL